MTKREKFADITRRQKLADAELKRREKLLNSYLNSKQAKRLRADVQRAIDAINVVIDEWNDTVIGRDERT
jgi:uncharacterized protein YnzC (UPF0291/DUF896 family)